MFVAFNAVENDVIFSVLVDLEYSILNKKKIQWQIT